MGKIKGLPERLKEEREKRGWSQTYIANVLKIEVPTYNGYERNRRTPSLEITIELANLFGVSIDYLVGRSNDDITPWWKKETLIGLEKVMVNNPNLLFFGKPISMDIKRKMLQVMKVVWDVTEENSINT